MPTLIPVSCAALGLSGPGTATDPFQREAERNAEAVRLVRDVRRGDCRVVGAEEFRQWIDPGKDKVTVGTMPYDAGYRK